MSQAERLSRIHFLIRSNGFVSLKELKKSFEVSRATLMRDIELMRDRLGAPVVYDPAENVYRYDPDAIVGEHLDELPGLWISASEGYAFLTLFNVLRAIDPGFLMYFLEPLRPIIKRFLTDRDFKMWRLDSKIVIDLPNFSKGRGVHLAPVFEALVKGNSIRLQWKDFSGEIHQSECQVTQLKLQETGWQLAIKPSPGDPCIVPLKDVQLCPSQAD